MKVFVLDTETTGLKGFPYDVVLDIGIVSVDLDDGTVTDVYSSNVGGYRVDEWPERMKNCWAYGHTELSLNRTALAKPYQQVAKEIKSILDGGLITSYNVAFDYSKFLAWFPWNLNLKNYHWMDCIMETCLLCEDIPLESLHDNGKKYPKLIDAYETLVYGDPAQLNGKQAHLALSDARVAGFVLYELYKRNLWPMTEKNPFRNGPRTEKIGLCHNAP